MHSRIFILGSHGEQYDPGPEALFCDLGANGFADSIDDDYDVDASIAMLKKALGTAAKWSGKRKFTIVNPEPILAKYYDQFKTVLSELEKVTSDDFANYKTNWLVAVLMETVQDNDGFHFYCPDFGLITYPELMRCAKNATYKIVNTYDFHA